jgi:hypothetical protein
VYTHQVYDDGGQPKTEERIVRMAGGQSFDHIPLHIPGANNNRPDIDHAPLYDLAVVNIAHYRNNADLEEAGFITGQPTLHLDTGDTSPEEFAQQNPNGVQLGSRQGIVTQGGNVELVQPEERSLLTNLKKEKEQEMIGIGARIVQRGAANETAEAARINASADASALDQVVNNLSDALTWATRRGHLLQAQHALLGRRVGQSGNDGSDPARRHGSYLPPSTAREHPPWSGLDP